MAGHRCDSEIFESSIEVGSKMRHRQSWRGRRRWRIWIVAIVIAAGLTVVPAASVDTGTLPREETVDVVADSDGVMGLDTVAEVEKGGGAELELVTITNRFDAPLTVTVSIVQNANSLSVDTDGDGTSEIEGDSVTFTLSGNGDSATVYVDTKASSGSTLVYDISATTTGSSVDAQREAQITSSGTGGGPPGGGPPGVP